MAPPGPQTAKLLLAFAVVLHRKDPGQTPNHAQNPGSINSNVVPITNWICQLGFQSVALVSELRFFYYLKPCRVILLQTPCLPASKQQHNGIANAVGPGLLNH